MRKFLIHNQEYFKKHFYKDPDGDWWISEELYDEYLKSYRSDEDTRFGESYYSGPIGEICDEENFLHDNGGAGFVIKEILIPETHPEHFL